MNNLKLNWLDKGPEVTTGVTWGIPWEQGVLDRQDTINLSSEAGKDVPVQSWPTAYWPDGSVKWTAHAAAFSPSQEGYKVAKGSVENKTAIVIVDNSEFVGVDTGVFKCKINKKGASIIGCISKNGKTLCSDGRLICIKEERKEENGSMLLRQDSFESEITDTAIEQSGPVRAVIRVDGVHKSMNGSEKMLPFILRLYFYYGVEDIKIVHTFIYDKDPAKDFIKGLGMEFSTPVRGPLYNRHIRFAGSDGLFKEASQLLLTWRPRIPTDIYGKQINGEIQKLDSEKNKEVFVNLDKITVWDSYKLIQDSSEHYLIQKRTKDNCSWIDSVHGKRADGLAFMGSENGGIAVGLRNFWQKCPSSLEISGLSKETGKLKVWFWSPDSKAMDLRHYDTETHVQTYYEGFEELRSTPYGIANTNELRLWCFDRVPDSEELLKCSREAQNPSLLICEPKYYHDVKAFGVWSLYDRSTPNKAYMEDELEAAFDFYKNEVEQRSWFGFWNYGDFMHTYDPTRHTWRYDMGGYAWQNNELVPDLWLWYAFIRSGRVDIFRIAEAMTRHTSEVDTYHIGEYAGLGSRHNVLHWGCGCKEARISMAGHNRFYYYLTGDERIGDIMEEVSDADFATLKLDPMRAYYEGQDNPYPTHTRSGPDWAAFCSNWITKWERFEDTSYRDKLLIGIESLKKAPFRLRSGQTFGYDPNTGELFYIGENEGGGSHLVICMGGPQIWMEMSELIKDTEWDDMMAEYGEFYCLSPEEKAKLTNGAIKGKGWSFPVFATAMMAFAAKRNNNTELAKKAWEILFNDRKEYSLKQIDVEASQYIKNLKELPWVSTNSVSQWALNAIVCLDLIGDELN